MAQARFAIVGAGNIGQVHAQTLAALSEPRLTVVCSRDETHGHEFGRRFGAEWTPDVEAAVSRAHVVIVCVCAPSGAHAEVAEAAAAGKHLLVEKPLGSSVSRRLVALKDAGRSS